MKFIKKYLSYLIPIPEKSMYSPVSGKVEINWNNGHRVIDTKTANYSYGNLQKLLKFGLKKLPNTYIANCNEILILGVAGGSVIETLRKDYRYTKNITGIEIDPAMIYWMNNEFQIHNNYNTTIIEIDANYFVRNTKNKYDLIVIDIFIDTDMPDFLFERSFIEHTFKILNPSGYMIFNTIFKNKTHKERNNTYYQNIQQYAKEVKRFDNLDGSNEIFLIKKI